VKAPYSTPTQSPLNCPKGYGLCWGCKVHCDSPLASVANVPQECACGQSLTSEKEQRDGLCRECL
jgi:hypothetical protein